MKLLVLCLLFGAALVLTRAEQLEDKLNDQAEDPKDPEDPEDPEDPDKDGNNVAEPESVDETELTEDDNGLENAENVEDYAGGICGKPCRFRWCRHLGRRYRFYTSRRRWASAQRHCLNLGGTLASIRSRGQENFLKSLALGRTAWIGYSDSQQNGYWFWINGKRNGYTNWCRGQPDNRGNQGCAVLNFSYKKCWDDQTCTSFKSYICEKK